MIRKISDLHNEKSRLISCEFYPPKTEKGHVQLFRTAEKLMQYTPDYFSVTYGAGGSVRDETTLNVVDKLQREFDIPVMHHLTCIGHSQSELKDLLKRIREKNVCNILALRGDPPKGESSWKPHPEGLTYTFELIDLIKSLDFDFSIGAAGFPEGHIDCPDKEKDSDHMKAKVLHGAEFIITQLFFDNRDYFGYIERAKSRDVAVPIVPGIIPITNFENIIRFCNICGASIPEKVKTLFEPLAEDAAATYRTGTDFAIKQCRELLDKGAPGIHFYTLNKSDPTCDILKSIL